MEMHAMRASHPPPPFFGSWLFAPFEAWCFFCHMAVRGDLDSYRDSRNSDQDDLNSYHDGGAICRVAKHGAATYAKCISRPLDVLLFIPPVEVFQSLSCSPFMSLRCLLQCSYAPGI